MRDPICGMDVDNDQFIIKSEGRIFHFCSAGCLEKFKKNPEGYADGYIYDLIIVGAGPAGLTASVYASILRMSTFLVTENIGGQATDSSKIVNYMGFDFISGKELIGLFENQLLHQHYIDHRIDSVSIVEEKDAIFSVSTMSGKKFQAYSVIIAAGMQRAKLNVLGEDRLLRKGVAFAFSQDLSLFAGKPVAVVGGGNSALQAVLELAKYKCKIYLISKSLKADPSIIEEVNKVPDLFIQEKHQVVEIKGTDQVEGIIVRSFENEEETFHKVNGVLIAIGQSPNSYIVEPLVDLNEKKEIMIAADCSTRAPGLFACGDITSVFDKRIIIASGEGAKAALSARRYLLKGKSHI